MISVFKNVQLFVSDEQPLLSGPDIVLVVKDDVIDYIGPAREITENIDYTDACIYELQDQIIAPAFFDGHMHLLLHGSSLSKINLEACKSLEDVRAVIKQGAAERPDASRLWCRGYMQFQLPTVPTAAMLDDLDPRPIFVNARDLHSTWCNTVALQELDLQNRADPEGGIIHRDATGRPTGYLEEAAAITIAWPHENRVTPYEQKLNQARAAIQAYTTCGYTSLIELATDDEIWNCMLDLHNEGVPMRMAAHWLITPSHNLRDVLKQVDRAIELHMHYNMETSPDCRIAGIKLMLDGTVDACTAAVSKPYRGDDSYTRPIWNPSHLREAVLHADRSGLQCALHAIGDAAVKLAIDTLESCGTPGRRHRIEHLELTSPEDARRLGRLGITASIQPAHADPAILRKWPELLGSDLCDRAFAYSNFHDGGATLSIGTDAPTAPTHPLQNLYVASTRKSARESTSGLEPVNPEFALPLPVSLAAAASGSAKSCFAENRVGTLEIGKMADFVILDVDWNDSDSLLKGTVKETWYGGVRVF